MSSTMPGVTVRLGDWTSRLGYEAIPAEVIEHAKLCVLDSLGCALFGSTQEWGSIARKTASLQSPGGAVSLWGGRAFAGAADAAFANGTAAHGFELDDVHLQSLMHPGAMTVPAAWAIVETKGASGKDLLCAVIAGYEVGLRVGLGTGVPHMLAGFHPTGTVGCICASAAAANAAKLPASQATHAIAIGATQAAGLYTASKSGAMVKRMHAGRAAHSGVYATLLAENGFTGSTHALEDPSAGFMTVYGNRTDLSESVSDLGQRWLTLEVGFKAYAACASAHTIVDALDLMMRNGLKHEDLARLTMRMSKIGINNVGWPYAPAGVVAAQMNGYYTAAVKLIDGDAFIEQYQESRLADPLILDLIKKMRIEHDPEIDAGGATMRHTVVMEAETHHGRRLQQRVEQRRGSAAYPLSRADLETKFRRTASQVLSGAAVGELLETVNALERMPDVRRLSELLRGG